MVVIIRYSQSHGSLKDPLKSNDFLIYSRTRELLSIVECKFVSTPPVKINQNKYCKAVIDYFKVGIIYVVNDGLHPLVATWEDSTH